MALKSREICQRTRRSDGAVSFHTVDAAGRLQAVSEIMYREWERMASRTDCLYSKNDSQFQRQYKTVYWN